MSPVLRPDSSNFSPYENTFPENVVQKHQVKQSPPSTAWSSYTYLGRPLIQAARSFVMKPDSMVSMQTSSRATAKFLRLVLLSSLAL